LSSEEVAAADEHTLQKLRVAAGHCPGFLINLSGLGQVTLSPVTVSKAKGGACGEGLILGCSGDL